MPLYSSNSPFITLADSIRHSLGIVNVESPSEGITPIRIDVGGNNSTPSNNTDVGINYTVDGTFIPSGVATISQTEGLNLFHKLNSGIQTTILEEIVFNNQGITSIAQLSQDGWNWEDSETFRGYLNSWDDSHNGNIKPDSLSFAEAIQKPIQIDLSDQSASFLSDDGTTAGTTDQSIKESTVSTTNKKVGLTVAALAGAFFLFS
jgi:hypothetical protein